MSHTPGPWKIDQPSGNPGEAEVITAPCGRTVCWTADTLSSEAFEDDDAFVTEEDLANARLIAAAPELLDALRELVDYDEGSSLRREPLYGYEVLQRCKAAIAKAEGGKGP